MKHSRISTVHDRASEHRAVRDVLLAVLVALTVTGINLAINFSDTLYGFFSAHSDLSFSGAIINGLFVWLAILLLFSFRRWRLATTRQIHLENVISSISPDVLMIVSPERRIQMCTDSVRRVFGYAPEDVVARTTDLLYGDRRADPTQSGEIREALEREGFHVGLATGKKSDGTTFPLELITGILRDKWGAVIVLRDITDRVRAQEERLRLEGRMRDQQKMESLGRLAGGIAHDFNNLLSIILGKTELSMMDLAKDDPMRKKLEGIRAASEYAGELCRQMLSYAGKGDRTEVEMDLSEIVRDMVELLLVSVPKTLTLKYALAPDLPAVKGDVVQIQQILMNLVTNAAEAVGDNQGTISIATGLMDCDEAALRDVRPAENLSAGRHVFLEVADSGPGMDEDTRRKIFDPFFTTRVTGRGLGLATVFGIVKGHGGAIHLTSSPGEGAVFRAILPCMDHAAPKLEEGEVYPKWQGEGTVLIVDDDKASRHVCGKMLSRIGFAVISSQGGRRAVEAFKQHAQDIAVVLLDASPSNLSREEVFSQLRELNPSLPILLGSGSGGRSDLHVCAPGAFRVP